MELTQSLKTSQLKIPFDESIDVKDKQAVAAYIRGDRQIIKNCILSEIRIPCMHTRADSIM